ncbi:MAG: AAA family ATPase, partial [Candidatus Kapaibacteriota bacterium]
MEGIFDEEGGKESQKFAFSPLAERMRPKTIDDVLGQEHLLGEGAPLRSFFREGKFPSMIFWGPPGVGKTTLAYLIAEVGKYDFIRISAVEAGVKEVKEIITKAKFNLSKNKPTLLFIDEIHRFNKAQQDYLLHAVEKGIVTLVGATTENPSFEVIPALLSRCQVYKLYPLDKESIKKILVKAINNDILLSKYSIEIEDFDIFHTLSGGDARIALNLLEISFNFCDKSQNKVFLSKDLVIKASQQKYLKFDKKGDYHYDTISAFI